MTDFIEMVLLVGREAEAKWPKNDFPEWSREARRGAHLHTAVQEFQAGRLAVEDGRLVRRKASQ